MPVRYLRLETTLLFSRFYRTTLILSNFIKENKITYRVRSALSSPHCWFRFYARSPEPLRLSIFLSILSYSIMQPRCYGAATTARACCRLRGLCGGARERGVAYARACGPGNGRLQHSHTTARGACWLLPGRPRHLALCLPE